MKKIIKFKIQIIFTILILGSYLLLKFALPSFVATKLDQVVLAETGLNLNIKKINFEPIGFFANIEGLSFSNKHLIQNLSLDLSLSNILKKRIVITDLKIDGFEALIKKEDSGYQLEHLKMAKDKSTNQSEGNNSWGLVIKKLEINNSKIKFNEGPVFHIHELTVLDFCSFDNLDPTSLAAKLSLNESKFEISGVVKSLVTNPSGNLNIRSNNFDLRDTNYFLPKDLGVIEGKFNINSDIIFSNNEQKYKINFNLLDFKLFSKDLKMTDYFIHNANLVDGNFLVNKNGISIDTNELNFENIILSIKTDDLNKKNNFFRNSKINFLGFKSYIPKEKILNGDGMFISSKINTTGIIDIKEEYTNKGKKLRVKLSDIDLLALSESFEANLGYQVETGKLDLTIETQTINKLQNGKGQVILKQFQIDDQDESGKATNTQTMLPLKTAFSMIRNDNGAIDLEFDISGNEDNPKFGFNSLLKDGIGSIILSKLSTIVATKAAVEFLPLLVSNLPFSPGNALMLVNGGYKFLTKPRFQDIEFLPNSAKLNQKSETSITKLKKFLKEKKNLNFVICPIASIYESSSKAHSVDNTLKLAMERIEKVKLEISDTPEIASQVIFCRPKIVENKTDIGILEVNL